MPAPSFAYVFFKTIVPSLVLAPWSKGSDSHNGILFGTAVVEDGQNVLQVHVSLAGSEMLYMCEIIGLMHDYFTKRRNEI